MKHYDDGKFNPVEEKPADVSRCASILTCKTLVEKHKDYYDSENSERLIDDFLKNVGSKFKPGRFDNGTLIINTRYWSTEPYRIKFFNDYIFFTLKENNY